MYFMGANVRLWYGHGPCLWIASMCALVPYPLCPSNPYSGCSSWILTCNKILRQSNCQYVRE